MSMSYATLMVNLDVGRPNKECLHIAGELAARFEARLIGVAGCRPPTAALLRGGRRGGGAD